MKHIPTEEEGREALRAHMLARACDARARHGPDIGADALRAILADPHCLRYPTTLAFDESPLQREEFAYPQITDAPDGRRVRLSLHPRLEPRPDQWPRAAAYYIPLINYGPIVTHDDCLRFAAALLNEAPETCEHALLRLREAPHDRPS